jgi:hypothetical protein
MILIFLENLLIALFMLHILFDALHAQHLVNKNNDCICFIEDFLSFFDLMLIIMIVVSRVFQIVINSFDNNFL